MKNKKLLKVATSVAALGLVAAVSFGATMAYLTAVSPKKTNTFTSNGISITLDEPDYRKDETPPYSPGDSFDKDPEIKAGQNSEATYVAMTLQYFRKADADDYEQGKLKSGLTSKKLGSEDWIVLTQTDFFKIAELNGISDEVGTIGNVVPITDHAESDMNKDVKPTNTNWIYGGPVGSNSTYVYYYGKSAAQGASASVNFIKIDTTAGTTSDPDDVVATNPLFTKVTFKTTPNYVGKKAPDVKIVATGYAVRAGSYESGAVANIKTDLQTLITGNSGNVSLQNA